MKPNKFKIDNMKNEAKSTVLASKIKHTAVLDLQAKSYGYSNWSLLMNDYHDRCKTLQRDHYFHFHKDETIVSLDVNKLSASGYRIDEPGFWTEWNVDMPYEVEELSIIALSNILGLSETPNTKIASVKVLRQFITELDFYRRREGWRIEAFIAVILEHPNFAMNLNAPIFSELTEYLSDIEHLTERSRLYAKKYFTPHAFETRFDLAILQFDETLTISLAKRAHEYIKPVFH